MSKKKKHEEHENHERWLVSYADFITLLFAFFVVMYSVSSVNEGKYRVLSESMVSAFTNQKPLGQMSVVELPLEQSRPAMEKDIQKRPDDFQVYIQVANALESLDHGSADVSVQNTARGISIKIKDEVAFDSGSVELKREVREILDLLAALVKNLPNLISVEGHTDTIPIRSAQFPSNWELSAARSAALVRYFINQHQLSPERFSATGFGGERPLESNETSEGRSANRRVEIVILRETAIPESDQMSSLF
ncbi:flagellar motor protein MotB [Candidatus Nitronereus thalassa]|uniref:Flagellar motor protein MotB n=1 Tax=Candidatus Nitronereus thalassa TaxID=3020898 RepID=A0ABU3K672_9BACT|nr:flagellar motor protein MotB [Candidatus Nitronereus thalassa]MDT7041871.1 flagellar motor protein MotB [Candidatus Nitronereus thalassa]